MKFACLLSVALWVLIPLSTDTFAQTDRGMGVSPEALPKALRDLSPKDFPISTNQKKAGVIHSLEGKAVIVHRATNEAFFATEGDPIHEKDAVHTLADSRCRIRFLDEDVVTMAPDTEFNVESFQDQRAEGKKSSVFSMVKGKAMFYALRLFRYRDTRFTVDTPTVTVGVRGTSFGVDVYFAGEDKRADRGVWVADLGNEIAPYLAQAGGPASFTNAFSADGVLNVGGQIVGPGQMFNGRTSQIIPTPPDVIRSFQQVTGMGVQGQQARTTPPAAATGGAPMPLLTTTGDLQSLAKDSDIVDVVTNQTSQQTGAQTETQTETKLKDEMVKRGPKDIGYFSAMLSWGGVNLEEVFVQFEDHRQYTTDAATGLGLKNSSNSMVGKPNFLGSSAYLERLNLVPIAGGDSGDLGTTRPISHSKLGSNEYMQWGYWTMTNPVVLGGNSYTVDNKAYYVVGEATYDIDKLKSFGNVTYSGSAWGTYFSPAGGSDMTGSFSTHVNLNNGAISNFTLAVSGGARSASVSNATGQIYGYTHNATNCSHFELDPTSGTWLLNGGPPTNKAAHGTLYGPNGEHIGGIWGMYGNMANGAVGNFVGSR
jgi:hypothetical protein